jgi:hypothetical protein
MKLKGKKRVKKYSIKRRKNWKIDLKRTKEKKRATSFAI